MIVIGVVLLVLSALLTLGIALFNGAASNASAFGVSLTNVSIGGLFLTGVVTGVVGALGIGLVLTGGARKRHQKSKIKRAASSALGKADNLSEENTRLQAQLEQERADSGRTTASTAATQSTSANSSDGPTSP